mgnify:CR=1 FL=1
MGLPRIGAGLRACRERANMTQRELADILHMDEADISRIENGRKPLDAELFFRWIQATNGKLLMDVYMYGDQAVTQLLKTG